VQHLKEQRTNPTDHHGRKFAMNESRYAVNVPKCFFGIVAARRRFVRQPGGMANRKSHALA
jgi:hypothetical protein